MLLSLRQAIYQKVQPSSEEDLFEIIQDSIGNNEKTLPGLGVLFEIIWQNLDKDTQTQLVHTLKEHLPTQAAASGK
jgi:small acid-soluble spore protein I (minor)